MSQGKFSSPRPHREEEREIEKAYRDLTRKQSHKTYEHRVTAENMARALGIQPDQVNVKATTEEGLGFTGDGSGMAAHAVVLLEM
mgnify:CR=1 FL=1